MQTKYDIVVIGGSAGSLHTIISVLGILGPSFPIPVIVVMHRMRNVSSDLNRLLSYSGKNIPITEPDDKELLKPNHVYLAPQNYHLLIDEGHISLDYSEAVMFSRPSIDVTFESVAHEYGERVACILLSGANNDGAAGLASVMAAGGIAIAQNPVTADYPVMPQAAINLSPGIFVYTPDEIVSFIKSIKTEQS